MTLPSLANNGTKIEPPYFFGSFSREDIERQATDDPFASQGWILHCEALASSLDVRESWLARARRHWRPQELAAHLEPPLRMIEERLAAERFERVAILDVGGGFGYNFLELRKRLSSRDLDRIDYVVVDNQRSCELGTSLYRGQSQRPTFITSLPSGRFDLVMAIGTLQYVLDWEDFLGACASRSKRCIYIARTPLTTAKTFFSLQAICPALGPQALHQVGICPIVVIAKPELTARLRALNFTAIQETHHTDYSANFRRVTPLPRVDYFMIRASRA